MKCHWNRRWNFQMHQIYTGKQFTSEEFLSSRYHARQRTCAEEKLDKICAKLEASPRKSLDSHSKECDWIITNKIKLMYLHPYKTTVVHKLWQLSAKVNFVNWYLQKVYAGEVNLMLVLFSDEAWFQHSWYMWPLKITLTVMLICWMNYNSWNVFQDRTPLLLKFNSAPGHLETGSHAVFGRPATMVRTLKYHRQQPLYNTLELLLMGIVVPETCWTCNKICNKILCCI